MRFGNSNFSNRRFNPNFEDDGTRRRFITKVCSILAFQLMITAFVTCIFIFIEGPRQWLIDHIWIVFIAIIIYVGCSLALMCCMKVARTVPINYILLIVLTLCMSLMVSVCCLKYDYSQILSAVGITAAVCISLAIFAACMPCDFTGCYPFLCICSLVLMGLGICTIFIRNRTLEWIYVCIGILVMSMYLVYDVQMMVGGHKNQYDEEDYIVAALSLYVDVIQMFLFILHLLGLIDSE